MTAGMARVTVFQEIRPGAGFKTGGFVREKLGGATVVRHIGTPKMRILWWYSEWGMRGWSVLGSVLLMGSGALVWSLLMARWIDSKACTLFPLH